jgi:hypothetical protein
MNICSKKDNLIVLFLDVLVDRSNMSVHNLTHTGKRPTEHTKNYAHLEERRSNC